MGIQKSKTVTSWDEACKYGTFTENGDGTYTVTYYVDQDGNEDESSFSMTEQRRRKEAKEHKHESKKANKPSESGTGYWGFWKNMLGGWVWLASPLLLILWIPVLILQLLWAIVKLVFTLVGLKFIFGLFAGSSDD